MTEPGHRLRPRRRCRRRAIRDDDHYVVNGAKTFITNGINADLVITAVKTDPTRAPPRHLACVVIERGMDGFERGRNLEKVGMHAQDTAELFFNDVRVPVENLLGEEGQGFRYLVSNLAQERLSIAVSRGRRGAQAALDWTLEYVKRAPGLRAADRLLPELALRAGRDADRDRARRRPSSTAASRRSTPAS